MRRPSYRGVTGVTAAMVALAAVRVAFQDRIPPPHPEIAARGQGDFVRRAEYQDVVWRSLEPATFRRAQRLTRPLLVVVGMPWSAVGRQADRAFAMPDVARALSRGFVPVRIDGAQDPRWASQFMPLQRTRMGFSVGFQAWVFDLKGRLIAFIGRTDANETINESGLLDSLVSAQEAFGKAVMEDGEPELQATQRRDAERILNPGVGNLSLANAARSLAEEIDPRWGGWNIHGFISARPLALRFLQLAGEWDGAGRALRQALFSTRTDWIDGGFYRVVRAQDGVPEYDKPTVFNAQFAEALAVQDAARPDPLLRAGAERTVRWLLGLRTGVFVPGAEMGDEDDKERSRRASFSSQRLRQAVASGDLKGEDRDWAEAHLGLEDPMRLAVPTLDVAADPRLEPVLDALRRVAGPPRERVATALCSVNGAVAACLLRCARLWDDPRLAEVGGEIVDRVDRSFRGPEGVFHSLDADPSDPRYLADALAYADACLADFLTNGRVPSLERGTKELRRALKTFGDADGSLRSAALQNTLIPGMAPLPQVTDDECEASTALALRLLGAYAAVLGPGGADFAAWAARLGSRLEAVTDPAPLMGGALGALAQRLDARAAFVLGPDALARASRLVRRLPDRLVIPVLGAARPDLAGRPPGLYLATATGLAGPFTEAQLYERLPRDLEVGLYVGR